MQEPVNDRADEMVGLELTRGQIRDYLRWSLDQKFPPGHPAWEVQVQFSLVAICNPASPEGEAKVARFAEALVGLADALGTNIPPRSRFVEGMLSYAKCHDCHVEQGEPHVDGCDEARCLVTGKQRLTCYGEENGEHHCGYDVHGPALT